MDNGGRGVPRPHTGQNFQELKSNVNFVVPVQGTGSKSSGYVVPPHPRWRHPCLLINSSILELQKASRLQ